MKTSKRFTGDVGEAIAERYLKAQGHILLERNYSRPYGEVDLITEKGGTIHFIEVKSVSCEIEQGSVIRENSSSFTAAERITRKKLRSIEKVAQTYLAKRSSTEEWQIDALLVEIDAEKLLTRVTVLEGVSREE